MYFVVPERLSYGVTPGVSHIIENGDPYSVDPPFWPYDLGLREYFQQYVSSLALFHQPKYFVTAGREYRVGIDRWIMVVPGSGRKC